MSEISNDPSEGNTKRILQQELDLLTTPLPEQDGTLKETGGAFTDRDEALMQRELALSDLASALADPDTGDSVAQLVIDHAQSAGPESPASNLYTYWGLMQKALGTRPDAKIPNSYLDFIQDFARREGDDDVLFAVATQDPDLQQLDQELDFVDIRLNPFKNFDFRKSLNEKYYSNKEIIDTYYKDFINLSDDKVPEDERADLEKLLYYFNNPHEMHEDIRNGRLADPKTGKVDFETLFTSERGRLAALCFLDSEFLDRKADNILDLKRAVYGGRLYTREGKNAALLMQDIHTIAAFASDLVKLERMLNKSQVIQTEEGRLAAALQHDKVLIETYAGNPSGLSNLVNRPNAFRSQAGLTAAKEITADAAQSDNFNSNRSNIQTEPSVPETGAEIEQPLIVGPSTAFELKEKIDLKTTEKQALFQNYTDYTGHVLDSVEGSELHDQDRILLSLITNDPDRTQDSIRLILRKLQTAEGKAVAYALHDKSLLEKIGSNPDGLISIQGTLTGDNILYTQEAREYALVLRDRTLLERYAENPRQLAKRLSGFSARDRFMTREAKDAARALNDKAILDQFADDVDALTQALRPQNGVSLQTTEGREIAKRRVAEILDQL